jgi:hypothetical protein
VKELVSKIWWWLTTTRQCCQCKRILHRRWVWLPPEVIYGGARVPRVTHGLCRPCFEKTISGLAFATKADKAPIHSGAAGVMGLAR